MITIATIVSLVGPNGLGSYKSGGKVWRNQCRANLNQRKPPKGDGINLLDSRGRQGGRQEGSQIGVRTIKKLVSSLAPCLVQHFI